MKPAIKRLSENAALMNMMAYQIENTPSYSNQTSTSTVLTAIEIY